jgi:hypothetical protein
LSNVEDKATPGGGASSERLPSDGTAALLKYYITKEEFAALDEGTRAHYFALGEDYRIKPEVTNTRQQKVALVVLFVLALTFAAIGLYGSKSTVCSCRFWGFAARCRRCSDFCFT